MARFKLKDIGTIITGNTPKTSDNRNYDSNDICFVKPSDIDDNELSDLCSSECYISEYARGKARIVPAQSVLVTCIGIIGKVGINSADCAFNQQINAIIPNIEKCDCRYLAYAIQRERPKLQSIANAPVVPILNKSQFSDIEIPLPPLSTQRRIAAVLDKVSALIAKRRQQLDKLDELVKSRFVEMFGDMLLNTKRWNEQPLESMADIVSGITKGRKIKEQSTIKVPYMAVANVKDGYIDWTTIKTIEATEQEIERYRLLTDDVLMTEGGDPDKLGRGAIIKEPLENCIHQNHIFRVRLNESMVLPGFFAEYLKHQKSKRYFLGCAKQTTGIASINMRQLKALPVLLPPLALQEQFAAFVAQTDKAKLAIQKGLEKLETLKKALMQEYFEGGNNNG